MRITRLLFIILAMAMLHSAGAQSINQRFGNNLSRGYYTFGLNAGWAYQSSDVRAASGGYGLGATLAKNLYYRNGAALAFDLRGRLLFARTYGLGLSRAYDIANNSALNGDRVLDYTTYPANLEEHKALFFITTVQIFSSWGWKEYSLSIVCGSERVLFFHFLEALAPIGIALK